MISLASILTYQNKSMGILCSETRPRKKDNAAKSVSSLRKIQAVTPYRITEAPHAERKEEYATHVESHIRLTKKGEQLKMKESVNVMNTRTANNHARKSGNDYTKIIVVRYERVIYSSLFCFFASHAMGPNGRYSQRKK